MSAHLALLMTFVRSRFAAQRDNPEGGLTTVEWVILIGIVVAMAATVGGIIAAKVTNKANSIPGL